MTCLQSLLTSSLLVLSAWAVASAQLQGLELLVSVSHDEPNGESQVTLTCCYQNRQKATTNRSLETITDKIREASLMSFLLNGTELSSKSDHGLLHYKEWDFESGAVAEFALNKKEMFLGTFACKTMTEKSSTAQLIFMPESDEELMTVLIACGVLCLGIVAFVIVLLLCFVCYKRSQCKAMHLKRQAVSFLDSEVSNGYPIATCSGFTPSLPGFQTNFSTGQQEPHTPYFPLHMQSGSVELKKFTYVDQPEEVMFDYNGGRYVSRDHEVELHVPRFAVPVGQRVTVRIAVSLTSPMQFPSGLRPVSPIVQFSVVDDPYFKFAKPVKLVLPHFLSVTSENSTSLQFLKASHNQGSFKECDGEGHFGVGKSYGMLFTNHFCHYCITCSMSDIQSKANFRLIKIIPRKLSPSWKAQFCVTYFLRSCLRSVEKFYETRDCEVTSLKRFSFSESLDKASLESHFERRLAGGWSLTQSGGSSKVNASEVDFWGMEEDELKQMEEEEIYPPRFVIGVNGNHAIETAVTSIKFSGAKEELQTELSLEPFMQPTGISRPPWHMRLSRQYELSTSISLPSLHSYPQQNSAASYTNCLTKYNLSRPSLPFLMNHVAVATSNWRGVGTQLSLSHGQLDQIEQDCSKVMDRFNAVFILWEKQPPGASPYEWLSLFDALNSPQVSENKLAADLELLVSTTVSNTSLSSSQSS